MSIAEYFIVSSPLPAHPEFHWFCPAVLAHLSQAAGRLCLPVGILAGVRWCVCVGAGQGDIVYTYPLCVYTVCFSMCVTYSMWVFLQ